MIPGDSEYHGVHQPIRPSVIQVCHEKIEVAYPNFSNVSNKQAMCFLW